MLRVLLLVILATAPVRAQFRKAAPDGVRPMQGITKELEKALRRVQREIGATEFGRRLLASTGEIPVAERARREGLPVEFVSGERPVFAVDRRRAKSLTLWEFEAYVVRARVVAASRITIPLVEAEMSHQQAILQYALEKTAVRPKFAKRLRREVEQWKLRIPETPPDLGSYTEDKAQDMHGLGYTE